MTMDISRWLAVFDGFPMAADQIVAWLNAKAAAHPELTEEIGVLRATLEQAKTDPDAQAKVSEAAAQAMALFAGKLAPVGPSQAHFG